MTSSVNLPWFCITNFVKISWFWCVAVMKNPANLAKHQANPRIAPVLAKMMTMFAGAM